MNRFIFLFFLIIFLNARGTGEGGESGPLVPVREGDWILYKGNLRVANLRVANLQVGRLQKGEDAEKLTTTLEVGYLGLGTAADGKHAERVLLLRSGESPQDEDIAFSEAVSLRYGPAGPDASASLQAEFPVQDRARSVSWFAFHHLPLGIFPSLQSQGGQPREWMAPLRAAVPAALAVFGPESRKLAAIHRIEPAGEASTIRYTIETEPDQKVTIFQNRMEIPFQVVSLKVAYTISTRQGRLLSFESRLQGTFPEARAGKNKGMEVEIELALSEYSKLEGARFAQLAAEAEMVRQIERALFEELNPEAAEGKATAFQKDHAGSRLVRFAAGLARQADAVWPIARERKFYGKPAPNFTLLDISGKKVTFSSLLPGKVTLLSFWAVG